MIYDGVNALMHGEAEIFFFRSDTDHVSFIFIVHPTNRLVDIPSR